MVIPDDNSRVREYRVCNVGLRSGLATLALAFIVLTTVGSGLVAKYYPRAEAERLARANAVLVDEVESLRQDLAVLESSLLDLSERDERYRILANLEPLDDDVKLAGVGGPGARTVQTSRLWQVDRHLAGLTFTTGEQLNALNRRAQVLASSWSEATGAMESQIDLWERTPSIYPAHGYVSSGFTLRRVHPILGVARPHMGIDVAARRGTPVVATAKGVVTFAGNTGGDYGYRVDIDHGHGVLTRYAHLARGSVRVKVGQSVDRWDAIGEVGTTGLVTGPSVHYEVIVDGRARNPSQYVIADKFPF
jgi:murein DD-endopeptidase MepM/ murein hydrolase activator NlpD